ncbi:DNA mismatch repair endonuclease MutL, partial [Escherichia coli]
LLEREGKIFLLALPVAERWLKQVQLTPGQNVACAQPLLIPVRLKISPEETGVLQRSQGKLAEMGIEIVLEAQHVTIRAVPLP